MNFKAHVRFWNTLVHYDLIFRLNARALMTVGKEWRSIPVWKEVIDFETSIENTTVSKKKRRERRTNALVREKKIEYSN